MMACTSATFESKFQAIGIKRKILRDSHMATTVYLCESCDKFHLKANKKHLHITKSAFDVLRHVALGYFHPEIARITGLRPRTVQWYIEELRRTFSASSSAHLVAIAISLGVIDPREFVPSLEEQECESATG